MKTTTGSASIEMLRGLYGLRNPIVSVYCGMEEPANSDDLALRRRAIRHELLRSAVGKTVLDAVEDALSTVPRGAGAVAAFVGRDGETRTFDMPDAVLADHVSRASVPSVLPLLSWQQYRPPYVVVLLDRSGAEISVRHPAHGESVTTTVPGPDDEIARSAPGGSSQSRYQNRAEDSWLHNSAHSAEVAADALTSAEADLLIVAGDVRAEQFFRDKLPEPVRQQVSVVSVSGGRSPDGSEEYRREQIARVVRDKVDGTMRDAVAEVLDQSGPGGLGAQGVAATIHALARGRVHELLVSPSGAATAWFGSGPTDISEHRSGISADAGPVRNAPLADVLVRAATLSDAKVLVLPPDIASPLHQGVGALCRYAEGVR